MRTLIFQSHAPKPPYWIERCTATVREWTAAKGYDYRLIGDELFEGTPPAIARKAPSVLPLTDLGRLLWTQRYLKEGYERVAWIDSDVVIFDPENFSIDSDSKHLVCREVMAKLDGGKLITTTAVNPTITVFQAGSPLLDCAETLLMMPDLLGWLLTGRRAGELTDASTTQLIDARAGTWSDELCAGLGLPRHILPDLIAPGR